MTSPEQLFVNNEKGERFLLYDEVLEEALPELSTKFQGVDDIYNGYHTDSSLEDAHEFEVPHRRLIDPHVKASVTHSPHDKPSNEALVVYAPFNDVAPESSGADILEYAALGEATWLDKQIAKPHSWNQTTKSVTTHDLLQLNSEGMPVITIFSPINQGFYSRQQRKDFKQGDFSNAYELTRLAVDQAQQVLHGFDGEMPRIDTLHFYGASLGASNAIGSADGALKAGEFNVGSVTAQELILGPESISDLANRMMFRDTVGDGGNLESESYEPRIPEPQIRREIDGHGNELQQWTRMGRAALKWSYLTGLTKPSPTIDAIEDLSANGVNVTVATAVNSAISSETQKHIKHIGDINRIFVNGLEGNLATHLINEHVTLSATIALLGIKGAKTA